QTEANPYPPVLGPKQLAALRNPRAQTLNGVGWMLGPFVGGAFFYSAGGVEAAHGRLYIPYAAVAIIVIVLALVFLVADVPDLPTNDEYYSTTFSPHGERRSIWKHPHFVAGVLAQFLYVAAQAGIF